MTMLGGEGDRRISINYDYAAGGGGGGDRRFSMNYDHARGGGGVT